MRGRLIAGEHLLPVPNPFVREILNDSVDAAMVEAIARIARISQLVTVAEYVETAEIRARLASLGVDYVQGYGVHVPEPLMLGRLPDSRKLGA